ncbi:MAG: glucoamylase family protein [Planctomycetota bacterium]
MAATTYNSSTGVSESTAYRTIRPVRNMLFCLACVFVVTVPRAPLAAQQPAPVLTDEQLLTITQQRTFEYFWSGAETNSLAARERIHLDAPQKDQHTVTSGGTGFGLMAILVGIERGFVSRHEGVERLARILGYLQSADRFHGAWPHWLHGETGKVRPFSPKDDGGDLVETSFLAQGLLCVRQYFADGNDSERQLAATADQLWRGIEWDWYRGAKRENVLFWHWSPRHDWAMDFRIRGYNECLITYILAASSPTHPIPAEVYHDGWAEGGKIIQPHSEYEITLPLKHQGVKRYCGPLFWSHYSFLGLDPHSLKDRYADYWQLSRDHVRMVRRYCLENPGRFVGYSDKSWGLTSSYSLRGYRGHRPGNDEGTIAPTAALSSMPYTPQESMKVLRHLYEKHGDKLFGRYGFYDAFHEGNDWFPPRYLAIDQGPIVVMIENHRTGLLWRLFMSSPEVKSGLLKLGFTTDSAE